MSSVSASCETVKGEPCQQSCAGMEVKTSRSSGNMPSQLSTWLSEQCPSASSHSVVLGGVLIGSSAAAHLPPPVSSHSLYGPDEQNPF